MPYLGGSLITQNEVLKQSEDPSILQEHCSAQSKKAPYPWPKIYREGGGVAVGGSIGSEWR